METDYAHVVHMNYTDVRGSAYIRQSCIPCVERLRIAKYTCCQLCAAVVIMTNDNYTMNNNNNRYSLLLLGSMVLQIFTNTKNRVRHLHDRPIMDMINANTVIKNNNKK